MAKKSKSEIPGNTSRVHPFKRVRRAGVPLSFFESQDPAATIIQCAKQLNGQGDVIPLVQYDISAQLRPVPGNKAGEAWLMSPGGQEIAQACPMGPAAVFQALAFKPIQVPLIKDGSPEMDADGNPVMVGGMVFVHNSHRLLEDFGSIQAVWNCRDAFKATGSGLVLMGCHSKLPQELKNDVPIFSEDVPTEDDIRAIVLSVCDDQGVDAAALDMRRVVDGLIGYLSAFNVEQSFCLSMKSKAEGGGVDYDQLWKLKVAGLKAMGLEITLPTAGFDTVGGNEGAKTIARYHLNGREAPRAILWIDEIEKSNAGAQAGNLDGGASMAITEHLLFWTAENRIKALLLLGVPGAGKSLLAKVIAAEAKCPLIRLSLSSVKGGIVGSTEANIRAALASVDAIAQGRVLMISTCNSVESLSPELMARHTLGTIFFDYPTPEESRAIWAYYMRKYELSGEVPRQAQNWVGREIEYCCERAYLWNIPLAEAASTVVPECVSNAQKLDTLRRSAHGRFLSAAHPGFYEVATVQASAGAAQGRKMNLS